VVLQAIRDHVADKGVVLDEKQLHVMPSAVQPPLTPAYAGFVYTD